MFSSQELMSWSEGRDTKRKEDKAYSLLGVFGVTMGIRYGEGEDSAMKRLLRNIEKHRDYPHTRKNQFVDTVSGGNDLQSISRKRKWSRDSNDGLCDRAPPSQPTISNPSDEATLSDVINQTDPPPGYPSGFMRRAEISPQEKPISLRSWYDQATRTLQLRQPLPGIRELQEPWFLELDEYKCHHYGMFSGVLHCVETITNGSGIQLRHVFERNSTTYIYLSCQDLLEPPRNVDHQPNHVSFGTKLLWKLLVRSFLMFFSFADGQSFEDYVRVQQRNAKFDDWNTRHPDLSRTVEVLTEIIASLMNSHDGWFLIVDHLDMCTSSEMKDVHSVINRLLGAFPVPRLYYFKVLLFEDRVVPAPLPSTRCDLWELPTQRFADQQMQRRAEHPFLRMVFEDTAYLNCLKAFHVERMHWFIQSFLPPETGTCSWIWKHPKYLSWDSGTTGILWIRGKPGSGKSALAVEMQKSILQSHAAMGTICLSWFYSARHRLLQHEAMIQGLIWQILRAKPHWYRTLKLKIDANTICSRNAVLDTFRLLLSRVEKEHNIILLIDGIDESEDRPHNRITSRKAILTFFHNLCSDSQKIKMILFSRPLDELLDCLDISRTITMHEENKDDIETVIWHGLRKLSAQVDPSLGNRDAPSGQSTLGNQTNQSFDEMLIYLLENAKGVILWVVAVLRLLSIIINEEPFCTWQHLIDQMHAIPNEITELYQKIADDLMNSFKSEHSILCLRRVLMWAGSKKTTGFFHTQDLIHVVAQSLQSGLHYGAGGHQILTAGSWVKVRNLSTFKKQIDRLCGPLIDIEARRASGKLSRLDRVSLFHETVRMFIEDPNVSGQLHFFFHEVEPQLIAEGRQYLEASLPGEILEDHPLTNVDHADDVQTKIESVCSYLEDRPLISLILTIFPELGADVPSRYRHILPEMFASGLRRGLTELDVTEKLFQHIFTEGQVNALGIFMNLSSLWLTPWEWYLLEPEIIRAAYTVANTYNLEKRMSVLTWYAGERQLHGLLSLSSHQVTPDATDGGSGGAPISGEEKMLAVETTIDEILCFFLMLATSPSLGDKSTFKGADVSRKKFEDFDSLKARISMIHMASLPDNRPTEEFPASKIWEKGDALTISGWLKGLRPSTGIYDALTHPSGLLKDSALRRMFIDIPKAPKTESEIEKTVVDFRLRRRLALTRPSLRFAFDEVPPFLLGDECDDGDAQPIQSIEHMSHMMLRWKENIYDRPVESEVARRV
ncbi:hypothetical protein F5Y16DRAFT_385024 [Xylariaceae sp. FL0255]|nr:hypothetical protein F5Y16DRAFT_385024 [Xylariaceae sp. FL0255]